MRRIVRARRAARAAPETPDAQEDEAVSSEGLAQALSKGKLAYFMLGLPWLLIPTQLWLSCAHFAPPPAPPHAPPPAFPAAPTACTFPNI